MCVCMSLTVLLIFPFYLQTNVIALMQSIVGEEEFGLGWRFGVAVALFVA